MNALLVLSCLSVFEAVQDLLTREWFLQMSLPTSAGIINLQAYPEARLPGGSPFCQVDSSDPHRAQVSF